MKQNGLFEMKQNGLKQNGLKQNDLFGLKVKKKIAMLTCYDFQTAKLLEQAGIDLILVGDSLGMVVLGFNDTKSVTMADMIRHTAAVARAVEKTPVIGDMPAGSYDSVEDALKNAKLLLEAGANAVKFEGCRPEIVSVLVKEKIPVMAHIGLLPQTAEKYCVQGYEKNDAKKIFEGAMVLDKLGVFAIVLECIPLSLAKKITENTNALTIGIGAGLYCNGQVLVINDLLGLNQKFKPKFVKQYANLSEKITTAVSNFKEEVLNGKFPLDKESFH